MTVAIVPNCDHFSVSNFRYNAAHLGVPIRMMRAWRGPPFRVDFVLVKTGSQGPPWTAERIERITRAVTGGDPYLSEVFPVVGRYTLPDGSVGSLHHEPARVELNTSPSTARARLVPSSGDRPLALAIDRVRIAGLPVPDLLTDWIVRHLDPTRALQRLPALITVPAVRIVPGCIEIGEREPPTEPPRQ